MIKLLIADDEPLVQIGIKSMLNWAEFGIEICGTADNGANALKLIEKYSPEIVITDIKMPIMSGLELAKTCSDRYGRIPLFIILTSYEEFSLIKEALSYHVLDYLVKLELDAAALTKAVNQALERLEELRFTEKRPGNGRPLLQNYHDKFFMRLLHNLFDHEDQFELQVKDLGLDFSARRFQAAQCAIYEEGHAALNQGQLMNLYNSSMQMTGDILNKHIPCHIVSLDLKHFSVIFHYPEKEACRSETLSEALHNARMMIHNYFNVTLRIGIGSVYESPLRISDSYQEARQALSLTTPDRPVADAGQTAPGKMKHAFNISLFKADIARSFEEFDTVILHQTLTEIMHLFSAHPLRCLQAVDGACNILYLAISLLPEGETTLSAIFSSYPDNYRSIYRMNQIDQVVEWMGILRDGLCNTLKNKRKTYKEHVIMSVQKYIQKHSEERLTLNGVAAVFGLSPNYLSVLFKKTCEIGFNEYITQIKIGKAKTLLLEQNMKVYEVADRLGFDSAFYFSKVFKKVEGLSPRDYINKNTIY